MASCKNKLDCNFGLRKCWFVHKGDIETAFKNTKDDVDYIMMNHDMDKNGETV